MDLQSNGSNLFNLRQSDSHSSLRNRSTGLSQSRSTTAAEAGWLEQRKSRWSHNRELQDTTKPGASGVKACHGRKTMRNSSLFPKHADHHHTLQSYNPTVQKHCIATSSPKHFCLSGALYATFLVHHMPHAPCTPQVLPICTLWSGASQE